MRIPNGSKYSTMVQHKHTSWAGRISQGRGCKGPLWENFQMRKLRSHSILIARCSSFYMYTLSPSPPTPTPFAPRCLLSVPEAAKYSCLWLAAYATAYPILSAIYQLQSGPPQGHFMYTLHISSQQGE